MKEKAVVQKSKKRLTKKTRKNNPTTNYMISPILTKREEQEFDAGVLKVWHERYIGEGI